nr:hypothetical protein [Tanacetum cinerariifolium]
DKIEVTPSKIHDMLGVPFGGYSLFDLDERETDHEFVRKWAGVPFGGYLFFDLDERETDHEFVRKWAGQFYPLELKKVRVNDIARKLIAAQEIDFLFKVNFLTLFTNTMGKADGLKGQICLDVVRRLREDSVISNIDWCGYIYDCLRDGKLSGGTNHYIGPLTFLIELELKDHVVGLLDLHDEWNEAEYVNLFKDPISFEDYGNGDNVGDDDDENVDDDENGDDDGGNVNNDCDVNGDSEDGDLFGDDSATLEAMNQEITPEKLPTQKENPSPKKEL